MGIGLRLRYDINRQFALYVGIIWSRSYGETADPRRAEGDEAHHARLVADIRFCF